MSSSYVNLQIQQDLGANPATVMDQAGNASGLQLSTGAGGGKGGNTAITAALTVGGPLSLFGGIGVSGGSVSMMGAPVALQLPPGFPLSENYEYSVNTDGWVVGAVNPDPQSGQLQQWGALTVNYTASNGAVIAVSTSGQTTGATGTVLDSTLTSLMVPVPSGTTFTLQFWGGKYAAPDCQAWFFPLGEGTATRVS